MNSMIWQLVGSSIAMCFLHLCLIEVTRTYMHIDTSQPAGSIDINCSSSLSLPCPARSVGFVPAQTFHNSLKIGSGARTTKTGPPPYN